MKQLAASILLGAFLFPVFNLTGAAQQAEEAGAKALFYDPTTKGFWPSNKKPTPAPAPRKTSPIAARMRRPVPPVATDEVPRNSGIHYWVESKGKCAAPEEQTFYTGDQIQFHVRSNVDGYLSLWALGTGGQRQQLFPPPDQPQMDNFVRAGVEYTPKGSIVFRPPAEDERLLVFF
jgi:hypothetical protein